MSFPNLQEEIAALREYASGDLSDEVQQLIADLIPLAYRITGLHSKHSDRMAEMFRSMIPLVTAKNPNLIVCRRLYAEIEVLVSWKRSLVMRFIYFLSRGGASSAALAGVVSALLLSMLIAWLLLPEFFLEQPEAPPAIEIATVDRLPGRDCAVVHDEPDVTGSVSENRYAIQVAEGACEHRLVANLGDLFDGTRSAVYEIVAGNEDQAFAVRKDALWLVDGSMLDHETSTERTLMVSVGDNDVSAVTVQLAIVDRNDVPVVPEHAVTVRGTVAAGSVLGRLTATDEDDGALTFTLVDGADQPFRLAPSGELTADEPLVPGSGETAPYVLAVEVSDDSGAVTQSRVTISHLPNVSKRLLQYDRKDLFALLVSAFLGSLASSVMSLTNKRESTAAELYDPERVFVRAFFKPVVAMIFALAVFSVLKTGIVTIEGLRVSGLGEAHFHMLWVIGFFSGFSERFAPRIFGQVAGEGQRRPT